MNLRKIFGLIKRNVIFY